MSDHPFLELDPGGNGSQALWDGVSSELALLSQHGLEAILFGGMAKEIYGVWHYGPHHDLDLLIVADDISVLDRFIDEMGRERYGQKRHTHKRAYRNGSGLLIEMFHVTQDAGGLVTSCYGHYQHRWQEPLFQNIELESGHRIRVVTPANIQAYESSHHRVQSAFYAAYPEIYHEIRLLYGDTRMPYDKYFRKP